MSIHSIKMSKSISIPGKVEKPPPQRIKYKSDIISPSTCLQLTMWEGNDNCGYSLSKVECYCLSGGLLSFLKTFNTYDFYHREEYQLDVIEDYHQPLTVKFKILKARKHIQTMMLRFVEDPTEFLSAISRWDFHVTKFGGLTYKIIEYDESSDSSSGSSDSSSSCSSTGSSSE